MTQSVALKDLLFLPELQGRAGGLSSTHVAEMVATLKTPGGKLPSLRVYHLPDSRMVVTDGWHTGQAHKDFGSEMVDAEVIEGNWAEAIWDASSRNAEHGLKRTNEDKERAISLALHAKPSASTQSIADHCRVSTTLAARVRAELEESKSLPVTTSRTGADGRTRAMPVFDRVPELNPTKKEVDVPVPRVEPVPEPVEETAGGDGIAIVVEGGSTASDSDGEGVEPLPEAPIPARSLPAHFKPGSHVDPSNEHADLLAAIVSLATRISKACNDADHESKLRQYLANVGWMLPRATIKGEKHIGWKCIGLRGVYRVIRLAGLPGRAKTKEQVRILYESDGDEP